MPAFRKPKSRNAATTLALMGGLAVTMMLGMVFLARVTDAHIVERSGAAVGRRARRLLPEDVDRPGRGDGVLRFPARLLRRVSFATGLILILACNTAFNGFPVLGSILAQDRYLPRQLHTRGDRLAFSNGIVFLAVVALILLIAFQAQRERR